MEKNEIQDVTNQNQWEHSKSGIKKKVYSIASIHKEGKRSHLNNINTQFKKLDNDQQGERQARKARQKKIIKEQKLMNCNPKNQ